MAEKPKWIELDCRDQYNEMGKFSVNDGNLEATKKKYLGLNI